MNYRMNDISQQQRKLGENTTGFRKADAYHKKNADSIIKILMTIVVIPVIVCGFKALIGAFKNK